MHFRASHSQSRTHLRHRPSQDRKAPGDRDSRNTRDELINPKTEAEERAARAKRESLAAEQQQMAAAADRSSAQDLQAPPTGSTPTSVSSPAHAFSPGPSTRMWL